MANHFIAELEKSNISYKITSDSDGKEYIHVDSKFEKQMEEIVWKVYDKKRGVRPPNGRSMRIDIDTQIIQDMNSFEIPYTTMKYDGIKYIVWNEEYSENVEQIFVKRRLEFEKLKKRAVEN